jgi:hypothetical protein
LWFLGLRPAKPPFFKVAVPKLKFWNSLTQYNKTGKNSLYYGVETLFKTRQVLERVHNSIIISEAP